MNEALRKANERYETWLKHQPRMRRRTVEDDQERELQLVLAELEASQQALAETVAELAKRVAAIAARLDGQQRYGSPTNETRADREQRQRDERLRNSPNAPSSMFRR